MGSQDIVCLGTVATRAISLPIRPLQTWYLPLLQFGSGAALSWDPPGALRRDCGEEV